MENPRFSRKALAAGAAAFGALSAIGVAQLAGSANPVMQFAQAQSSSDSTTVASADQPARARRAPLDAETAAKVKAAAEAAVPGATYQRGHQNHDDTGYKALVTKSDGTKVLVHMNNEFTATKVEDPAPARGHRGPGHERLDAETAAKVKAAAEAAVSGATYQRGHKNHDDSGYKALATKSDGTKVLVHMNNEFTVTKVDDPAPERPKGPGHHRGDGHGHGDRDKATAPTTAATNTSV